MATFLTAPVTVVQGDDAPDILVTIEQDSSGVPLVLTNKLPYVVLVNTVETDTYVAKFPATVEDANLGKIRISWIKDPLEMTSYLDDLTPGVRYEIQIYLGRTDLPPSQITVGAYYGWFSGDYNFTGEYQEGSPVYKHPTEELFLSRSPYTTGGDPNGWAWLITSLKADTWDNVKDQNKTTLTVDDLVLIPVWNYRQILSGTAAPDYINTPAVDVPFTTDPNFIITPDGKFVPTIYDANITGADDALTNGLYNGDAAIEEAAHNDNGARVENDKRYFQHYVDVNPETWYMYPGGFLDELYTNPSQDFANVPLTGWVATPENVGDTSTPIVDLDHLFENLQADSFTAPEVDAETRGTQTVLTHIPLRVRTAYRLATDDN